MVKCALHICVFVVLYIDVYMKKTVLHSGKMKKKIVHAFVRLYFDQLSARDCFVFLAYHWCLAANLRIGIYNWEMVFNRLLGNGWLDLDDFLGRPPMEFRFR